MRKLTPDFYVHSAESLKKSLTGQTVDTIHYIGISESNVPWNNISVEPDLSVQEIQHNEKKKIIAAKKVMAADVSMMIRGYFWAQGQVYDAYTNTEELTNKRFYTAVKRPDGSFSVWKCLHNNNGLQVTTAPVFSSTSAAERYHITSDGYMWKFMYRVTAAQARKFSSGDWIPVIENAQVKSSAIPGSLDTIKVVESGARYNSYSYGTFRQIQVAGDPLIYSLSTEQNLNTILFRVNPQSGNFVNNQLSPIFVGTSTEISGSNGLTTNIDRAYQFKVHDTDGASFVSLFSESSVALPNITHIYQFPTIESAFTTQTDPVTGLPIRVINFANASVVALSISTQYRYIPSLSANTDFYKNSAMYVRSGRGAGQLRIVAEYIVAGNERRVVLDKPFETVPDLNSTFEILPRIIISGDGTGSNGTGQATAIPVIDSASNSIISVQIVDPGKGYSYATAIAIANTGYIDITTGKPITANEAIIVPVIPPQGGHGSNVHSELHATSVCISKDFVNNEGGLITVGNDFGRILLLKGLQASNTEMTLSVNSLLFQDDEEVVQDDGMAKGIVSNRDGNVLRLSHIEGQFQVGKNILTKRQTSNVSGGIVDIDRSVEILNGLIRFSVEIQNYGFDGQGFKQDNAVYQGDAGVDNANATGFVFAVQGNIMTITDSRGVWNVSDDISGTVATIINNANGAVAKVTGIVGSDIQPGSGTIQHIETITPVTRNDGQSETVRLIISTKESE